MENTKKTTRDLADNLNPEFIYQQTSTSLLCAIANGEIDPKELALRELRNRGVDSNGIWVGFKSK